MSETHDVIVVGAGFAGLSAAAALVEAGLSVLVVEARDRVGGRVESRVNALGERIDTGGQYFCDDMPAIVALARRHGRSLVSALRPGAVLDMPYGHDEALEGRLAAMRQELGALDPDDPALRTMSVSEWIEARHRGDRAGAAFRSLVDGLWCRPADEIPLWHLADAERRMVTEVSELQYFPADTMHALAEDVAAGLGDRIRLSSPVTGIALRDDRVTAISGETRFEARRALVAVPPAMMPRIAFEPALPGDLAAAMAAWKPGAVTKVLLRYAAPFWRERGLSGTVRWIEPAGLYVCDSSRSDREPRLTLFVGATMTRALAGRDEAELRGFAIEAVAGALGDEATAPLDVTVRAWLDDRWSGGAYSDLIVDMGARDAEARILRGWGPVHFTASELSPSFPGYVEGALVAGREAARRLAAGLAEQRIRP